MYTDDDHQKAARALAALIQDKLTDSDGQAATAVNPALVGTDPPPAAALQVDGLDRPTLIVAIY